MAGTSVSGIGTGIDTKAIVSALVNSEKTPKLNQITTQRSSTNSTLSAIGSLKSALDTFQSALKKLNDESAFTGLSAKSSKEEFVKVTASNSAVNGSYTVNVTQLATSSKVVSSAIPQSSTSSFPAGTLKIYQGIPQGTPYEINISEGTSLEGVRDAINSELQAKGITANILTDADGTSRLMLSSTTTGENTDLSVDGVNADSSVSGGLDTFDIAAPAKTLTQNAQLTVDGVSISSKSNTLDKSISGLSLTLVSVGESKVSVDANKDGMQKSVQSFVDAYNALIKATTSLTKVTATQGTDSTSTTAAALTGDSIVRNLLSDIRGQLTSVSDSAGGGISMLSQLGIMTKQDGTLEVNTANLDKALTENYASVAGFFTGESGLLNRISNKTDVYTKKDGILADRQTSLQGKLSDLDEQEDALDRRIEQLETALNAKYNAMDSLVAQLNATSTSVLTTLNALNNRKE